MAHTFWVLVREHQMPSVKDLVSSIRESEFPLDLDDGWSWKSQSGWLPMTWDDEEIGCEVDFETLANDDVKAASAAGYPDLDAVVVLTTSGWESLKAAYAFAGSLVVGGKGCVSEGEDSYIGHKKATTWVRQAVDAAATGQRKEFERAAAKDEALSDGNLEGQLNAALRKFTGEVRKFMLLNDKIAIYLDKGGFIFGGSWKLHTADRIYDASRFRALKQRQMQLMMSDDPDEGLRKYSELEPELDRVSSLDEEDAESAFSLLNAMVGDVAVVEARWVTPHRIEVELSAADSPVIEYIGDAYLSEISVNSDSVTFSVGESLRVI